MSTYQYYEFQAIDRPLTATEKAEIGKQSSRVEVDARKAVFNFTTIVTFEGNPQSD
jgi:hypothetical protein